MSDLSFNFNCLYKWDYAKQIIQAPLIRSAFLLNADPDKVAFALQHTDFVVVRVFDPFNEYDGGNNPDFEKAILDRHDPQDFVDYLNTHWSRFRGNAKVRFVLGWNELYSKRGNDERRQNVLMQNVGLAMVNAGYGVGLGAWAADKSFYADDINAGQWDSLLLFAMANKNMVSLDVHEYSVTRPFNQHLKSYPDGYPATLLNPVAMRIENAGKIPYYTSEGNIEGNYHIGRVALLLERAKQLTGDFFYWYRGESAHDFKDDGALKEFIKNDYTPRFGRPSGINTMWNYYRFINGNDIDDSRFDAMLLEDYNWLAQNSPASCQANFIFAHNTGYWHEFDTTRRPGFVSLIANHNSGGYEPPDKPDPDPDFNFPDSLFTPVNVKSNTGGNVRIRDNYGTKSRVIGAFTPTPVKVAYVNPIDGNNPAYPPEKDGFSWLQFKLQNGAIAWSALELLDLYEEDDCENYKKAIEDIRVIISNL